MPPSVKTIHIHGKSTLIELLEKNATLFSTL